MASNDNFAEDNFDTNGGADGSAAQQDENNTFYDESQVYDEENNNTTMNATNPSENGEQTAAEDAAEAAEAQAAARVAHEAATASAAAAEQDRVKQFVEAQSDAYKQIYAATGSQLDTAVCTKLEELVSQNKLSLSDLSSEPVLKELKELNENCLEAFVEFVASPPPAESNGETKTEATTGPERLVDSITKWKKLAGNEAKLNSAVRKANEENAEKKIQSLFADATTGKKGRQGAPQQRPGPNEQKLKEILARTGYSHEVSSGQRKYGGPPPDWPPKSAETKAAEAAEAMETSTIKTEDAEMSEQHKAEDADAASIQPKPIPLPPPGCECFVGKLPRDLFEDELIPVFEKHGKIWDLRLMIDPSTGLSKGYCFVTYCDKESAQTAAKNLNDADIRPGKPMRVNISVANLKLFVGNIPKTKTKEELKQEFSKVVEGVSDVVIYNQVPEPGAAEVNNDKFKNRGFCFIEFIDHKSASMAKRKLSSSRFNRVFNREIAVDWADPNDEPDEETMSKVKVLYVRNISAEVTEPEVQALFETYGKLERVRKMKDYAFVHFEQRDDAVKAMNEQQGKTLGKNPIEISLARPLTDKKKQAQQKRQEKKFGGDGNMSMMNVSWNNNGNFNPRQQNNNRNFNNQFDGGFQGNRNGGGQMNRFNNNRNNAGGGGGGGGGRFMNNNQQQQQQRGNNQQRFNNNNRPNNFGSPNFNPNNQNGGRGGGGNRNQNFGGNNMNRNQNQMGGRNPNQQRPQNQMQGGGGGGNKMMNKRKGDNNYPNINQNKKPRFIPNNNGVSMDSINSNGNGGWGGNQMGQNFGNQQGNDASNEWYQDNFNSNQWV